jgi:hypothetical protein
MKKLLSGLFGRKPAPPPAPAPAPKAPAQAERVAPLAEAPIATLMQTAFGEGEAHLQVHARQRLAELIDAGEVDFDEFCRGREDQPVTLAIAALCRESNRLEPLLGRMEDAALARLATDGPSSRVRQAAAERIDDPTRLHDLLPRVRGKDKSVYRIIKRKCDFLLEEQRKAEAIAQEAKSVCESLERHAQRPYDALYGATVDALTARWQALPAAVDESVRLRAQQAIAKCGTTLEAHASEVAARAAESAAAQVAREERNRAIEAEQAALREADVAKAEADARAAEAAAAAREAQAQAEAERHAAMTQAQREVGSLIRLSTAALQRGDSRKAARFRASLEEVMQSAPPLPPYLARSLQQLDERLNELRQWKDYAVAPKRIELIEEMEALIGVDEDPETLAEHVRALQQEWRTINKGIAVDAASNEAERFQQAFQAAFKPCQAHFAAQAAVRREHLEARRQVVERLKAFEASLQAESPDYGFIQQVLREAPQEWRSHFPVDRDAGRPVEKEFNAVLDRLRAHLNGWFENNKADRQALIALARRLTATEDTTQAIEEVKRLQVRWKESGPVARDQHQALWEEFRSLCDAVFDRRQQAQAQYSAALEAAKAQVLMLCEQVERAAADAAVLEKASAHAQVREWNSAFDAIGELPRNESRSLRERFDRALGKFEAALAQQDQRNAAAGESNLFDAARRIRAYERAAMRGAPEDERTALGSAAEEFIASVARWPKGSLQALKQALLRASTIDGNEGAREKSLRRLCIRAEILASAPTPPEDAALRSDYEMRLLMEGLGQARQADDRDWDTMRLEWISIGAITPAVHDELEQRFRSCLARRPARDPYEARYRSHDGRDREPRRERQERDRGRR